MRLRGARRTYPTQTLPRRLRGWPLAVVLLGLAVALLAVWRERYAPIPVRRQASGLPMMQVRRVNDGDTLTCVDGDGREVKIRMRGIDAPEFGQAHGRDASSALHRKLHGRAVSIEGVARDQYGRLLATLWLDGRNVNLEMVAEGHAWAFDFSEDPELSAAEAEARSQRRGLWISPDAQSPSQWRKTHPRDPPRVAP